MQKYGFDKNRDLVCGENIHQQAELYNAQFQAGYDVLGEDLTYRNICDMTLAVNITSEFFDVPCVSIIKAQVPTGVALGKDVAEAFQKALDCDPVNAFGSVIAASSTITEEAAQSIALVAPAVVIAPNFDELAIDLLKKTSKIVKLNTKLEDFKKINNEEIKVTPFGVLVQEKDKQELDKDKFKVMTKLKPTAEQIQDAVFAWKISKYLRSYVVVVAKDLKTSAIVQGQNDLILSVELALNKSCDQSKEAVMSVNTEICTKEIIEDAAQGRISLIIQPAETSKDKELAKLSDKFNISMLKTGVSNYKC